MKTAFYFLVRKEDGQSLTWIGGGLRRSERRGFVWLTTQDGKAVLEVHVADVLPSTEEEFIQRVKDDAIYKANERAGAPSDTTSEL